MMQMQMPKFANINSDFICIYEKIAGGHSFARDLGPHRNCCLSLYVNIARIRQGPGKMFTGSWKFLHPSEWEPWCEYHVALL